jgi:hypothetical protein
MKTNDLLLLTVSIAVMHNPVYCQSNTSSALPEDSIAPVSPEMHPNMFRMFTGGINALYTGEQARGGIDLSVQTYHYYLITGKRDLDSVKLKSAELNTRDRYNGFEFFLLNRAAIDFDSTRSLANDYITSLQASPLTLRFMKEFFFTEQRAITSTSFSPILSVKLTGDGRAVPYEDQRSNVNIGASGHIFVTISTQFTRLEFDHSGKEIDRGTMYLQPSFGIAVGNNELMKSIFTDHQNKILLSSECRLGFKSHKKTVNDCSLLVRYTLSDIVGPKLRAGIILSSFN